MSGVNSTASLLAEGAPIVPSFLSEDAEEQCFFVHFTLAGCLLLHEAAVHSRLLPSDSAPPGKGATHLHFGPVLDQLPLILLYFLSADFSGIGSNA